MILNVKFDDIEKGARSMPKNKKMNQKRKKRASFETQLLRVRSQSKLSKWVIEISHWEQAFHGEIFCEVGITQYDGKLCLGTTSIDCESLIDARRVLEAFENALEKAERKYAQLINR